MKVAVVNLIKDIIGNGRPCSKEDWATISKALAEATEQKPPTRKSSVARKIKMNCVKREILSDLENGIIDNMVTSLLSDLGDIRMAHKTRDQGVHMRHCNQGEYVGSCKYGEDDTCPALIGGVNATVL